MYIPRIEVYEKSKLQNEKKKKCSYWLLIR